MQSEARIDIVWGSSGTERTRKPNKVVESHLKGWELIRPVR
jgi:hypothetical protein